MQHRYDGLTEEQKEMIDPLQLLLLSCLVKHKLNNVPINAAREE